ncbi:MAG: type II toxin-antitoxin system RelE/ParE family toxin [Chitinophagales bacterium]|nr:type II toxin-antitoxin system RelE/ParE family toxin [Chitinophagales bacterium]HMV15637.1 type II toxin-antitoxin system RelE/ParE family toxin [Chitinophagales bacterium]HMW12334.1 type II toxin-antitoxin system RelE/ParE family toxin [Chitinophagales bacterium]HMX59800.1 type II toxin-antitoxin system RelE/ParE family toxin [Chitinophagales bacterium]HMY22608.1 type II toxin-antitoxin system RelE/ParE family toxin [Chitinophagales bacterium]
MAFKIIISKSATQSLQDILDYTSLNFGKKKHDILLKKIEDAIFTISEHPLLFPKIKETIHRVLIINEISMFYQIKSTSIRILLFWNNRQNPNRLRL